MAVSVNPNQTYRLRDLRDNAVPRARAEPRAPTRRPKFEDSLRDPKAGEVVGQFPANFDKAPARAQPRRSTLAEATSRSRPRQAVAALMAREGISTETKFSRRRLDKDETFAAGAAKEDDTPAWMKLLPEAKTEPVKNSEEQVFEKRLEKLEEAKKELKALDRFSHSIDGGYSALEKQLKSMDHRVLNEAGKLDRKIASKQVSKEAMNIELMKTQMAMDQQLNMKYLQLQEKLQRGLTSLLSNLLKVRNETVKNAISNV